MSTRYIHATDAAKLARQVLKAHFPGAKFYVRTAHGTEIRISWTDGPAETAVKRLTQGYNGRSFDGMIDMAYGSDSWLNTETGEARFAYTEGTYGSAGSDPGASAPSPWPLEVSEYVHFSASVSLRRKFSQAALEKVAAQVSQEYGIAAPEIRVTGLDTEFEEWGFAWDTRRDAWEERRFSEALDEYDGYVPPAKVEPAPNTTETAESGIRAFHDRDWTWVYFDADPPVRGSWVYSVLAGSGARFSAKRTEVRNVAAAWYIRERVDLDGLIALLLAAQARARQGEELPQGEPLGEGLTSPSYGHDRRAVVQSDWSTNKPLVFSW